MAMVCIISGFFTNNLIYSEPTKSTNETLKAYNETLAAYIEQDSYSHYITTYKDMNKINKEYVIEGKNYSRSEGMEVALLNNYEGMEGAALLTEEQGFVEWQVTIEEAGLYNMSVLYYPIQGKSSDIQRGLFIDGKLPFAEASTINFSRFWINELPVLKVDNQGNDIRPAQIEAPKWSQHSVRDAKGYYEKPLQFYLSKGQHTITFVSQREPMLIKSITLLGEEEIPTYQEKLKEYSEKGYGKAKGKIVTIEAETASLKSSPMLYPITDHSSPAINPYSPKEVKINTIGGSKWRTAGQWIEWTVEAPESGLYEIGLNVKQNFVRGNRITRRLTIDGKVPFEEAEKIDFEYKNDWRVERMGDGENPYLFYLEKGQHTLRLEVVLGDLASCIREVETSVRHLNDIYRQVIMVTGVEPDKYRDYQLGKVIPEVPKLMAEERDRLNTVAAQVKELIGSSSDTDESLLTMSKQLDRFNKDIEDVIPRLAHFKLNIGALGTWLMQINEQPLEIDAIYLMPPGDSMPKTNNSFLNKTWHNIQKLYYSFVVDYNAIGNVSTDKGARSITVWVGTGRDQANSIKSLIDESFTSETGINVNLMLVQADTLLPATLSGQGPDVAMQVTNDIPINYAMRGAVTNLREFKDYEEVAERFYESAKVSYAYNNAAYALPETQSFYMLFYRKDILKELGIEVPTTWDEAKICLSVLSKNNMELGLPIITVSTADMIYGMFLYQMGGEFYTADAKASALDSDNAINAFKELVRYYADYTLTREFDFVNRFRTGEMPIGIADYQTYNTLQVSAPEIDGLWGFTVVPGTVKEDGTIDNSVPSAGTGIIMMEQAKDKEAAWEYMKWWTSEETQTKYGREMEGLMGAAARYPTANKEALASLPWPIVDYKSLSKQLESVKGMPQIPGGYYNGRNINNAFYQVVVDKEVGAREALTDGIRYINEEIEYKRKEFGLDE